MDEQVKKAALDRINAESVSPHLVRFCRRNWPYLFVIGLCLNFATFIMVLHKIM